MGLLIFTLLVRMPGLKYGFEITTDAIDPKIFAAKITCRSGV